MTISIGVLQRSMLQLGSMVQIVKLGVRGGPLVSFAVLVFAGRNGVALQKAVSVPEPGCSKS